MDPCPVTMGTGVVNGKERGAYHWNVFFNARFLKTYNISSLFYMQRESLLHIFHFFLLVSIKVQISKDPQAKRS